MAVQVGAGGLGREGQSDTADEQLSPERRSFPAPTSDDAGKVLKVTDDGTGFELAAGTLVASIDETTVDKILSNDGDVTEWIDAPAGGGGLPDPIAETGFTAGTFGFDTSDTIELTGGNAQIIPWNTFYMLDGTSPASGSTGYATLDLIGGTDPGNAPVIHQAGWYMVGVEVDMAAPVTGAVEIQVDAGLNGTSRAHIPTGADKWAGDFLVYLGADKSMTVSLKAVGDESVDYVEFVFMPVFAGFDPAP